MKTTLGGMDLSKMTPNLPETSAKLAPSTALSAGIGTVLQVPQPGLNLAHSIQKDTISSTDIKSSVSQTIPEPETDTKKHRNEPEISDNIIRNAIVDEINNFKKELSDLIVRCKNVKLNVGTENEKTNLVELTEALSEFYTELQDITDSQVAEVQSLKQALVQSVAWHEDAKSRHLRYIDPSFSSLLICQELDPVSKKQLEDIQHLTYYIDSQLKLVDGFLDNQWADFQDSCKKYVQGRYIVPTMEPIYQTMVRLHGILATQAYVLKDISNKMKIRNKKAAGLTHVMNDHIKKSIKEASDTTDVEAELRKLKIDHCEVFTARYEKLVDTEKKYTQKKESKLCSYYTNRHVVKISPKKPKFSTSYTNSKLQEYSLKLSKTQSFSLSDSQFNNTAEANLSATNIFSFPLTSSGKNTSKEITPQRERIQQLGTKINQTVVTTVENKPAFGGAIISRPPVSVVTTTTAAKQLFNPITDKPLSYTSYELYGDKKPAVENKLTFNIGSNISITPVSIAKTTEIKPVSGPLYVTPTDEPKVRDDTEKITLNFKTNTAKIVLSQPEIKPIIKIVTTAAPSITQSFTFVAPQPKVITKEEATTLKVSADSTKSDLNSSAFTFGSNLQSGQISTPKPKSVPSTTVPVAIAKPKPVLTTTIASSVAPSTVGSMAFKAMVSSASPGFGQSWTSPTNAFAAPQSSFSFTQALGSTPFGAASATSTTSASASTFAQPTSTIVTTQSAFGQKSSAASSPQVTAPSVFGSIFGQTASSPGFIQTQAATVTTTIATVSSIFGGITSTSTVLSQPQPSTGSVFGQAPSLPDKSAVTSPIFGGKSTETATLSGFSFLQAQTSVASALLQPQTSVASSGFVQPQTSVASLGGSSIVQPQTSVASPGGSTFVQPQTSVASTSLKSQTSVASGSTFFQPQASVAGVGGTGFLQPQPSVASPGESQTSVASPGGSILLKPQTPVGSVGGSTFLQPQTSAASTFLKPQTSVVSVGESSFLQPQTTVVSTITTTSGSFFGGITAAVTTASTTIFGSVPKSAEVTTSTETKTTQESFGFGSLTVSSSADPNKFSFGNLTVSALSPNASNVATAVTVASTNTFSFALPASTAAQTGFGSPGNIFAKPVSTSSSFMGQPICSPSSFGQNTGSIFGQSTGNIFAQKSTASGNVFGQSGGSIFGTAATTSSGSIFGQSSSTPFGTTNTPTTSASIFGQSSAFGAMNTTSATTGSIFGQSAFGSPAATTASTFSFTQNTSPGFGSPSGSIFGAKPTFGGAPSFGQTPTFGGAPTFGSPSQSGGSIFGSPTQPQQPAGGFGSGFGSPSTFGSPPAFGQSAFGGSPAFGGAPAFGSPQKIFGSTSPATGNFFYWTYS